MNSNETSKTSRRRFLCMVGVGAGALVTADTLFAKLFAAKAMPLTLPAMVYDPGLQMMVDPETREPLYVRAAMLAAQDKSDDKSKGQNPSSNNSSTSKSNKSSKKKSAKSDKSKPLPTVTAGCSNCPKCDDHCG